MIQQETIIQVADNSGAKTAKCIKVLGGYKKKTATIGNLIVVSIQGLRNKSKLTSKVKKGEVYKALVMRTKKEIKKKDGSVLYLSKKTKKNNAVILINKKGNLIASRVTEPLPYKLRKKQLLKFTNNSRGLL